MEWSRRSFLAGSGATLGSAVAGCLSAPRVGPTPVLLSWQGDPTTTMTVDWHVDNGNHPTGRLEYRPLGADEWIERQGSSRPLEIYDRMVYRHELTGLAPNTTYELRVDGGRAYRFRTLPATLEEPFTFAVGGDAGPERWGPVVEEGLAYDPAFVVFGGDIAYDDGGTRHTPSEARRRWHRWLETAMTALVDENDRLVPVIAGLGDHETRGRGVYYDTAERAYEPTDEWREWFAPYFYHFFAFPGHPGYDVLDVGDFLTVPVMDTEHTNPIEGHQTAWLEDALAARSDIPHVLPVYHSPMWPSNDEREPRHERVEQHWAPLFEDADVRFAFEHDQHTYKRSPPIADGNIDENGIVYMGDGCLGRRPREVFPERWFIDRAQSVRHIHVVTVEDDSQQVRTITEDGTIIDDIERQIVTSG